MENRQTNQMESIVDGRFWRHITREAIILDVIRFADLDRKQFLRELANKVDSGNYHPTTCWIIGFPKVEGIIRPVMAMTLSDSSIYYYCLKLIQDRLVAKIAEVEHVYGGFRITEQLQMEPSELDSLVYDPNYEGFTSYNYRKAWSDYQNLAKRLSEANFDYYLHLDIAHFYDAIRIDILEREVRNIASDSEGVVDLLVYFLKNLRPSYQANYTDNAVGIPQEEVGEMSRLLANFYLSSFDKKLLKPLERLFAGTRGTTFQYSRYADDIWIVFYGSKEQAKHASQIVGQLLSDLGLHLNDAKSRILTKSEYDQHWCFKEWDQVHSQKDDYKALIKTLKSIYLHRQHLGRWFTPFIYGLKTLAGKNLKTVKLNRKDAVWLVEVLLNEAQVMSRKNRTITTFYTELLRQNQSLAKRVLDHLLGRNALYPLVSYVMWDIVLPILERDVALDSMRLIYLRETWRDLWWYERCVALKYFASNSSYIANRKELLAELLKRIDDKSETMNELERRATIRFLSSLPDQKGTAVLKTKFGQPRDVTLATYLNKS